MLVLLLLLSPAARANTDPLGKVPGWLLLTPPGRVTFEAVTLARRARELQTTAPLYPISRRLEELRQLRFRYPVRFTVKTPGGVRSFLEGEIDQFYPATRMRRDEAMLKALGFVPESFELEPFLLDLLEEQIAGAYDPEDDYFFLVLKPSSWLSRAFASSEEQQMITLHELDHALQNQHFNLLGKQRELAQRADTDRELAFSAVVEGDATSVMYDLSLAKQGMTSADYPMSMEAMGSMLTTLPLPGMGKFQKAPLYFQRQLIFPYLTGCDFINEMRRAGGWELVNELYDDLPISSEQILHPERYWLGDDPLPLLFRLTLPGWENLGEDTGGEFTARVFLEQHGAPNYKRAAEGWGADRLAVFARGQEHCLVWLSRWDTTADAREFAAAARKADLPGPWLIEGRGDLVLLARNVPPALRGRLNRLLDLAANSGGRPWGSRQRL